MFPTRDEAWTLLTDYTTSESLRKNALAVEAALRGYARKFDENESEWGIVGLIHDFDYERWPDPENHPFRGSEILEEREYPEHIIRAILSHADYSGVLRETPLEHTLFACDEMTGFLTAASLVRPSKSILDLEVRSVKKRMKDEAFARAVSRDDLRRGAEEIKLPLDEHIANEGYYPNAPDKSSYLRRRGRVRHFDGVNVSSWVYVFNGTLEKASRILSGDYAAHVSHSEVDRGLFFPEEKAWQRRKSFIKRYC